MSTIATFTPDENKNAVCFWQDEIFSNFADCTKSPIIIKGKSFRWSEQVFMLVKTLYFYKKENFGKEVFKKHLINLMNATHPKMTKDVGRSIPMNESDIAEWNAVSRSVMYFANWHKYQDPERRKMLESSLGKRLVEASPYDKIWGVGCTEKDFRKGKCNGENRLGQVLEEIRGAPSNIILPQYQKDFQLCDSLLDLAK